MIMSRYSYFTRLFFHFDLKNVIKYIAIYKKFYIFMEAIFAGQTPVPPRSGTWILDLSYDPILAIWG